MPPARVQQRRVGPANGLVWRVLVEAASSFSSLAKGSARDTGGVSPVRDISAAMGPSMTDGWRLQPVTTAGTSVESLTSGLRPAR